MIKFKQRDYSIPEGHYTGPKDIEKIPGAVEMVTKGALGGAGIGAVAGGVMKDTTMLEGAITGAKWGSLGGIVAKFFLNYVHKPMTSVKYQEVDRNIRRQFGVYQLAGVTVGDTLDKRASIDDKFSFNDRDVSKYKLNFAIHDNRVTMYTFGMTKEELDKTSKSLDYYCKQYFSMEYTAKIINQKVNAYSVDIVFTNYQVICNFIMELSQTLNTKINLLNNNVIIEPRLTNALKKMESEEEEVKEFSVSEINRYDLKKILKGGLGKIIRGGKLNVSGYIMETIIALLMKVGSDELIKMGVKLKRGDYNNTFLESTLKKLHYIEGFNYTVGSDNNEVNMSMISGVFVISAIKDIAEGEIDGKLWKSLKDKVSRSNMGKVIVYTYALKEEKEFELILNKLMLCNIKPNIFEKSGIKSFSDNMIDKVEEKLKSEKIVDYEVSDKVPGDVISINAELGALKIYIPKDYEYSQYEIDDFIRGLSKFIRTNVSMERNINVMKLNGSLTFVQYYKLVKYIIESQGFCTILSI